MVAAGHGDAKSRTVGARRRPSSRDRMTGRPAGRRHRDFAILSSN